MCITRSTGRTLLRLVIMLGAVACQPSGRLDTGPVPPPSGRRSGEAVSMQELARYPAGQNLYEVLRAVRPFWIIDRGRTPSVSIDGAQPRELEALRGIQVALVQEVRLLRAHYSSAVMPTMLPGGAIDFRDVIVVIMRSR
jgi:hypothetical protein